MSGDESKRNWATLATAATAIVTIAAATIYGLGAISLGLKLWIIKDPWITVLGQLPSSFLIVASFSYIIFPTVLAGVFVYFLYHHLAKRGKLPKSTRNNKQNLLYLAVLPISLAAIPVGFQLYFEHFRGQKLIVGVERSWWAIFGLCLVLSVGSVYLARRALLLVKSNERRSKVSNSDIRRVLSGGMRIGIAALALTPCVAFTSAVIPLPVVVLCGAAFHHVDRFGNNYQIGNLIGTSGQWAYLAETKRQIKGKPIYSGHYIAVVPLSAVRLAAITSGNFSECNDLTPPMTLKSGYYVSGKPNDKPDSPHWFILLTTDSNGNTSGTIAFVGRDRRPGLSQTFTGHAHSGFAVLTFSEAGLRTASYESAFIDLENCWDWLKNISNGAQCVFSTRN